MTQDQLRLQMSAKLKDKADKVKARAAERGIPIIWTCALRSPKVQLALVLQGRTIEEAIAFLTARLPTAKPIVKQFIPALIDMLKKTKLSAFDFCNEYRATVAGLDPIGKGDWYEVTWTVNSNHYANAQGLAEAVDFALDIPGHYWDVKIDSNKANGPDFDEIGKIMKEEGLLWGGDFKDRNGKPKPDRPHGELKPEDKLQARV